RGVLGLGLRLPLGGGRGRLGGGVGPEGERVGRRVGSLRGWCFGFRRGEGLVGREVERVAGWGRGRIVERQWLDRFDRLRGGSGGGFGSGDGLRLGQRG